MNGSRLMVRSGLTAGVIAIVAEGCVGKVASNNEASTVHRTPDGNHGSAGFTEIAPGLPALDEAGPAAVSAVSPADDAGLSVSPGSPPAEAGSSACPNPDPVANPGEAGIGDELSYRRVTFRVTNTGAKDVYLSGLGRGCTDYSIDGIDGCPVPLLVWRERGCRSDQNWGYADTFLRLSPGQTYETNWDATEVLAYNVSGCVVGASRLVKPAVYRVTFGFEWSPPAGCNADSTRPDLWYCPSRPGLPDGPVFAPRCSTSGIAAAEFVLPAPPQTTGHDAGFDQTLVAVALNSGQ